MSAIAKHGYTCPQCSGPAYVCFAEHTDHDGPKLHCERASLHNSPLEVVKPEPHGDPSGCSCGGRCPDCDPRPYVVTPACESCTGSGCPDCMVEVPA